MTGVQTCALPIYYRADRPVDLFPLDGHLHLQGVRVETTDVAAYNALRTGVAS